MPNWTPGSCFRFCAGRMVQLEMAAGACTTGLVPASGRVASCGPGGHSFGMLKPKVRAFD